MSPDVTDETKFFYDYLGRLIVSQDARQRDLATDAWSYIIYDDLGRIEESGEIINSTQMTETIARATSGTTYATWLGLGSQKQQVVRTQYETSLSGVAALFPNSEQKNTRNRVTSITWEAIDNNDPDTYDNASHFSYDIHGNVDYLVQYNKQLEDIEQDVKHIRYEYDLISGNVKSVHYQEGEFDEFHHGYLYDADNRVTTSYTWRGPLLSNAVETWEKEQKNFYYLTGPLQRQEIGDKTVQAMDYAYTAQGWIKVMNAGSISSTRDMGRDAYSENISGATSTNMYTALDASGFVLNYFSSSNRNGDYWAPAITTAGSANAYVPNVTSTATRADYYNLYNGNIASMITSLSDETETVIDNQITAYKYDQLNRIKQVRAHRNYNTSTNAFAGSSGNDGKYQESFTFDRNGNIINVDRNGNNTGGTQVMDDFTYYYYDNTGTSFGYAGAMPINATNKLAYVTDGATLTNYTTDIDNQSADNYEYDGNGNLVKDPSEQIETIEWYANGKIKKIERETSSDKSDLEFIYDASGNRIIKITKPRDGTGVLSQLHWTMMYYVRDASGNVMAVYERTFEEDEGENDIFYDNFKNAELHIYGSKRVGTNNVDSLITFAFEDADFMDSYGDYFDQPDYDPITGSSPCTTHCKTNHRRELGNKQYEVTNHLGNVLATVSDRRLNEDNYSYTTSGSGSYNYDGTRNIYYAVTAGTGTHNRVTASSDNRADWYTADVISYSDYYAFGAQMDGRNGGQKYRYDFNGKETDPESDLQDYGMRIYNARLGKFLSVDPLSKEYPWNSTYAFAENDVIRSIDLDGCEKRITNSVVDGPYQHNTPQYYNFRTGGGNTGFPFPGIPLAAPHQIQNAQLKQTNSFEIQRGSNYAKQLELKQKVQEQCNLSPVVFGGGDHGYGLYEGLQDGAEQAAVMFAPEVGAEWLLSRFLLTASEASALGSTMYHTSPGYFPTLVNGQISTTVGRGFLAGNRWGNGFYASFEASTSLAEAWRLGASGVGYTYKFSQVAIMDYRILNLTGRAGIFGMKPFNYLVGGAAKALRFDGVIYNSYQAGVKGVNMVFFNSGAANVVLGSARCVGNARIGFDTAVLNPVKSLR